MKFSLEGARELFVGAKPSFKIGILLLLGLLLILLSGVGTEKKVETVTEEDRVAKMCAMIEGVGECRVMMTYKSDENEVYAVLVLCDGGDSVTVREKITSLFCSLYGIGSNRVEIQRLCN